MTAENPPNIVNMLEKPLIIIAGPTAVGKTELSLTVAERLGAEIISADSRQIYRELTIGTAKPPPGELVRAPHHFINERSLGEDYSAGQYYRDAGERINQILSRGRVPLVVGGSTLFLHALKHGLADIPDVPLAVRESIRDRLRIEGPEVLYSELESIDPASARRMDPTKTQRLLRALEVYAATGRPLSHYHSLQAAPPYRSRMFVLNRDRKDLYRRINERVEQMLAQGLLREVEAVLAKGIDPSLNPLRTIGYQEPIAYLSGQIPYDEMVRQIMRNTRRYAKRQLTWFRRDETNIWIRADRPVEELLEEIA